MNFSEEEKIAYISNLIHIALRDNFLSPKELTVLEEIKKNLGIKKQQYNMAYKIAENPSYKLNVFGTFSKQILNLSDMLYLSHIDGDFSKDEKESIISFAEKIGLTEKLLQKMIKEAEISSEGFKNNIECPKCKIENESKARFCTNCGSQLSKSNIEIIKTEFNIPSTGFAIEFAESTGSSFPLALEVAKQAPIFESVLKNKKNWYLAVWQQDQFSDVIKLAENLSGLRNKKYYLNGKEENWESGFGFLWCYKNRENSFEPEMYCFGKDDNRINPWGCQQIHLDWTEWSRWFSFGKYISNGKNYIWQFDKEKILHELNQNLHKVRMCPYIKQNLIQAILDNFPLTVNVELDKDWSYKRAYEEVPGAIKVIEKSDSEYFGYENEYYSDGVRPIGFNYLKKLLQESFNNANMDKELLKKLLS